MFGVTISVLFAVLAIVSVIVLCIRAVINIHFAKLNKKYKRFSEQIAKAEQELKLL